MKSYEEKMSQLKSDLETQHQRLLEEKMAQLQTELTNAHEKEIHQVCLSLCLSVCRLNIY
jgi:hypothetical protein